MTPNFSGVWRANLEKTRLIGPAAKSITAKINHSPAELFVEIVFAAADGAEHRLRFRAPTTGEEAINTVNGQQWRSSIQWVGPDLLIESWVDMGERKGHFRDFWSLSKDGRSLTMEHRDDDINGQITVLEKAAEAH
ncbi:MAG: hypothetical protein ACRD4V_05760 [Candidatus Acidiferrales bacterium]